jgi:hypothetical protein
MKFEIQKYGSVGKRAKGELFAHPIFRTSTE